MMQLVKWWLAQGEDVRIFTARVNPNHHQGVTSSMFAELLECGVNTTLDKF